VSETVGALEGLRIVELSGERACLAGKLLADMGAEVITVEPPDGDPMRGYGPFLDDIPDPERSLYFWHYHTSKRGITCDLESDAGRALFRELVRTADCVIESEPPGRLAALGLDYPDFEEKVIEKDRPQLIWVSVTPFGREGPRAGECATDLTLFAGGGPAWSCGYDDHSLPPVRGGGNQAYHTGSHFAVLSLLVALLVRDETGEGQFIDVNMHAAANVTTEASSYDWLVARGTVQRQTGRHAATRMTLPTQVECADGRHANTGVPPRRPDEFAAVHEWLVSLGLIGEFPEAVFLEMGAQREGAIDFWQAADDDEVRAIFGAGREALNLIASRTAAYEFFTGAQQRGIAVGVIYSPEEVMEDPHFKARGFPVEVPHPELGRSFVYPGAPYRFEKSPWRLRRRAPLLGEDNAVVYAELGLDAGELTRLREQHII
jgi:crotonobetainyl-CoA:carnitine CoA-transferase CaiB-like acyl-CoA transferase